MPPSSLRSPIGSLARLEEREEDGRGRKEETEEKKSPQDLGHLPKGGEAAASQTVDNFPPRAQRPTMAELKAKYGDNWGFAADYAGQGNDLNRGPRLPQLDL